MLNAALPIDFTKGSVNDEQLAVWDIGANEVLHGLTVLSAAVVDDEKRSPLDQGLDLGRDALARKEPVLKRGAQVGRAGS